MEADALKQNLRSLWLLHVLCAAAFFLAAQCLLYFYNPAPPHPAMIFQAYLDILSAPIILAILKGVGLMLLGTGILIGTGRPSVLHFLVFLNKGAHFLCLILAGGSALLVFYHGLGFLLFVTVALFLLLLRLGRDKLLAALSLAEETGFAPSDLILSFLSLIFLAAVFLAAKYLSL